MDNLEKLIEKYKKDMFSLSKRSTFISPQEINETAEPVITSAEDSSINEPEQKSEADKPHFGSLKVMVFAGNEAFPVETARVEVINSAGTVLYSLLTNSGGIAQGMILKAPDKAENDAPGGKDGFSVYTVRVSHPDYGTQVFDNVQVFEGVESVQLVFFQTEENIKPNEGEADAG